MTNKQRTLTEAGVLHSCTKEQVDALIEKSAYLTESGWVIPDWAILMRETVVHNSVEQDDGR
jgi:hypothetical protein